MREYLKNMPNPYGNCLVPAYDKRQGKWKKERKKYGFDERQTWNLNTTMIELLYERVMMLKEINFVYFDFIRQLLTTKRKLNQNG